MAKLLYSPMTATKFPSIRRQKGFRHFVVGKKTREPSKSTRDQHSKRPYQKPSNTAVPRDHTKSPITPPFQEHHSKRRCQEPTHHPVKTPRGLQHPLHGLGCHEDVLHLMVISLCCVLVAVGTGFVIFVTSCDRVRSSVVVRTIWLQYRGSSCSADNFRGAVVGRGE